MQPLGRSVARTASSCALALAGAHPRSCVVVGVVEIQDTASANKVDDKSLRGEYTVRRVPCLFCRKGIKVLDGSKYIWVVTAASHVSFSF